MLISVLILAAVVSAGEYDTVIHPGKDDGSGFWNERAKWFMYAPSFPFKAVAGAANYRFTVTDTKGGKNVFVAEKPTASLSPVWAKVNVADITVVCEGVDASGAVVGKAGERTFWKAAGFESGKYPMPDRSIREAARRVYEYVYNKPATQYLIDTGKFDLKDPINSYAAKNGTALIRAMLTYAKLDPAKRERAILVAEKAAEYLISISQPVGTPLEYLVPTYAGPGEGTTGKENADRTMIKEPAGVVSCFLDLATATGKAKYRDLAVKMGETFLRLQGEDGTWYLKVFLKDAKPCNPNRLLPLDMMSMFEKLYAETGRTEFRAAADRAFAYLYRVRMESWNWEGQFEDTPPSKPYQNLTKHPACAMAIYLGKRFPGDPKHIAEMRELLRFAEDQFVCWEQPCDGGPVRHFSTWHPSDSYSEWLTPCALEQYGCYWPIDASAIKLIRTYLALYKAEHKAVDLEKAKVLAASVLKAQRPDGSIPTWWFHWDGKTCQGGQDWQNCMVASAAALAELAEVMEEPPEKVPRPIPNAALLNRMRSGVDVIGIVHFTVNTFTDREWGYGSENPSDFNPTAFDAEQIVKACRDGGIKGLVIVAKHHDGFCLWPTKTTEHNISKSPFRCGRGDYVKEMELACRKYGVEFGVYCSPWDRNNAEYAGEKYVETYHSQVRELLDGRYGKVFEMWFDGANGGDGYYGGAWEKRKIEKDYYRFDEIFKFVRELQPEICIFGMGGEFTWPGNESGIVPPESGGTRNSERFSMYEADFPLRPGWFYHKSQDGFVRSGEFLMKIYLRTVGNAATMNIGIAPDRRGRLTDEDAGSLKSFEEIRTTFFSKPVTSAVEPFNIIEMTEDVTSGERVDAWRILLDGRELASGGKIGMKRIRVLRQPVSGHELKLEIAKGDADPGEIKIRLFAAAEALVRRVLDSTEPDRAPAPYERRGVLTARQPFELVYIMKHPAEVSSLLLTPDVAALGGTPIVFCLAYSADGVTWIEDPVEYRLDNVAANPIKQMVEFGNTVTVKYLKLRVVRTLEPGVPAALKGIEFLR